MADIEQPSVPLLEPHMPSVPVLDPEDPAGHVTEPAGDAREEFQIEERTEVRKREKWSYNVEFILACLSYSLVFGNLWRLPYQMYRSGGVAFLFPYIYFTLLFGVPLFYMETCLGQFWGKGPFHIFKITPILRGFGLAMIILNFIIVMYTNTFLAWFSFYAVNSMFSTLPWTTCDNDWNTPNCGRSTNYSYNYVSPAEEYYNNRALNLSDGINTAGSLRWELVLGMMFGTVMLFAALFWGVKVLGKVLFVSLGVPILIMAILCIRATTLPGAAVGMKYLIYPDFQRLQDVSMYIDALQHALSTVGTSAGVYHTMASYNNFKAPCLRNSFTVMVISMSIGLLSGITFMSFQAALAYQLNVPMDNVVNAGMPMVFITLPDILSTLPVPHLWCFLLFAMFFLFTFSCQIVSVEVFITTIMDIMPKPSRKIRIIVTAAVCAIFFFLSLPFLTQGGYYLFIFFDWFCTRTCFWFFCVFECVLVAGFYGLEQFSEDIRMMTTLRPPVVYKFIWTFLLPLLSLLGYAILMRDTFMYPIQVYDYIYPAYINGIGHFFAYIPLAAIPAFAIFWCVKSRRSDGPLQPDSDLRPATDGWMDYELKQRKMERSLCANLKAVFKT